MHNRTAILCEPNPNKLDDEGMCTVELEKEFRDVFFSVLAKWSNFRKAEDQHALWTSSHSLTSKTLAEEGRHKSLDMVFTDETVGNILCGHFISSHIQSKDVHEFLSQSGIDSAFTRGENSHLTPFTKKKMMMKTDHVKNSL